MKLYDTTLREMFNDISDEVGGLPTSIMFKEQGWYAKDEDDPDNFQFLNPVLGQCLSFDDPLVQRALDIEFDNGFGGEYAPELIAWTSEWVIMKHEYDGAEMLRAFPRNPRGDAQ